MNLPVMEDAEFEKYRKLIYDTVGINLGLAKKQLLMTRLAKRMNELQLRSYDAYREHILRDASGQEMVLLLNAVSTNKTDFFRENNHFEFLNQHVYPQLKQQPSIRIWSAACSSGEEPYTIAMTLVEALGGSVGNKDVKILATDISTKVLDEGEKGQYSSKILEPIAPQLRQKYFKRIPSQWDDLYEVSDQLKSLIRFRRLNLMEDFPLRAKFDFIMCRNVMIYFDKPTQERLVNRLAEYIEPGGYLFIGHSESLIGVKTDLKYVQSSIYRRN